MFKIIPDRGQVFLRYAIADGNGEEAKPFKAEWATVKVGRARRPFQQQLLPPLRRCSHSTLTRLPAPVALQDGLLFVGSVGRELVDAVRPRAQHTLPSTPPPVYAPSPAAPSNGRPRRAGS